jgi:hypothetical protein
MGKTEMAPGISERSGKVSIPALVEAQWIEVRNLDPYA